MLFYNSIRMGLSANVNYVRIRHILVKITNSISRTIPEAVVLTVRCDCMVQPRAVLWIFYVTSSYCYLKDSDSSESFVVFVLSVLS